MIEDIGLKEKNLYMIRIAIGSTGEFNNIRNPFVPSFYGRDEVTTMLLGLMYQNDQGWEVTIPKHPTKRTTRNSF